MNQIALDFSRELGRKAMQRAQVKAENAAPGFTVHAAAYMYAYLVANGPTRGEALTDAAVAAGHAPQELRSFGAVFKRLTKIGARVVGTCARRRGHGASGGKVYGV